MEVIQYISFLFRNMAKLYNFKFILINYSNKLKLSLVAFTIHSEFRKLNKTQTANER